MPTRTLYAVRHGLADPLGTLTETGREQCRRLGARLAAVPLDVIWHSPLPRAAESAAVVAQSFPGVLVDEAEELIDHVPFVPEPADRPPAWVGFFDGWTSQEAEDGRRRAEALVSRFARAPGPGQRSTHELLVTHAYPVAWLVRELLGAPPAAWLSLAGIANTGLTVVEFADDAPPAVRCVNDLTHLAGSGDGAGSASGSGAGAGSGSGAGAGSGSGAEPGPEAPPARGGAS